MSELSESLSRGFVWWTGEDGTWIPIKEKAADEIERLTKQRDELAAALLWAAAECHRRKWDAEDGSVAFDMIHHLGVDIKAKHKALAKMDGDEE